MPQNDPTKSPDRATNSYLYQLVPTSPMYVWLAVRFKKVIQYKECGEKEVELQNKFHHIFHEIDGWLVEDRLTD
jgi:hypothetical protein